MINLTRIPSTTGGRLMNANLQTAYKKLTTLQDQLSSGKQLQRASDDPSAVVAALDSRTQLARSKQYERNTSDAKAWLDTADSALMTSQDYLNRVRDLTIQSQSGGLDQKARDAIASEIDQISSSLVQLGNTTYNGRAIFAGNGKTLNPVQTTGQPDPLANAAAVMRPVAPGIDVAVNTDTASLYGAWSGAPGGSYAGNTFEVLAKLSADIRNPSAPGASVAAGQVALDTARDRMSSVQATLGARSARLDDIKSRNSQVTQDLTAGLAEIEDIDLPATIIQVQTQQMAYQAALSVTAKVVQPSLVDFLR